MSVSQPLPRCVFHLTPVVALPGIIESGGLVPPAMRTQLAGDARGCRWGINADIGGDLVCTSLRPSWAMLRHQYGGTAVAVIKLDLITILGLPDIRPCPVNSASRAARPFLYGTNDRVMAMGECLTVPRERWSDVEILIAGKVPLSAITDVVLMQECCDAGWQHGIEGLLVSAGHTARVGPRDARDVLPDDYLLNLLLVPRPPFPEGGWRKVRVYELARSEGLPSANVLARLGRAGFSVRRASSNVDEAWALHVLSPNRHPEPDHPLAN